MLTAFLGWIIIALALGCVSLAILYPAYRWLRRSRSAASKWTYLILSMLVSVALWFTIPAVVHSLVAHAH